MKSRKKVPADPAGRVGPKRPDNKPRRRKHKDVHELETDGEPDARFDDERRPDESAREEPGGRPAGHDRGYRNTDEAF